MNLQPTYNMVPGSGTTSSHLSMPQRGLTSGYTSRQAAARMRGDTTNLPVILFDPLGTNTLTDKEKENNPLIKAFVKTLEEANTQFECQRIVMDSLDIVSAAGKQCVSLVMVTAMRRCGSDSTHDVVHYGII